MNLEKIKKGFKYLVFGPVTPFHNQNVGSAIKLQKKTLRNIWLNNGYPSFGIERLIRLSLSLFQFISIGLYIRHIFGWFGLLWRKIGVELLVLIKLVFPVLILLFGLTSSFWIPYVLGYLIIDTIFYIAGIIFLADIYKGTITYKRSLITLFFNYLEITLDFAVIYAHFDSVKEQFFTRKLENSFEAVYFSFVTSATVGYGDIAPKTPLGQFLVIAQIILFFIFIGIFLNYFTSKINSETFYNRKPSQNTNKANAKKQ